MEKIKTFVSYFEYEESKPKTDEKVNKWLEKNPNIQIIQMVSNLTDEDGDLTQLLTIRYTEKSEKEVTL